MRGGETEVLQALVGRDDIVPAFITVWGFGRWNVLVGWRRSDDSPTQYWLDIEGNLTMEPQQGENPLTHKEFAYEHVKSLSKFSVAQEEGEPDYVVEPEDEWHFVGDTRAAESAFLDFSQLDEETAELANYLQSHLENAEGSITEGDLSSDAALNAILGEFVGYNRQHKEVWRGGLMGQTQTLERMFQIEEPNQRQLEIIAFLEGNIERLERIYATYNSFHKDHAIYRTEEARPERHVPANLYSPVEGSHVIPANEIEKQVMAYRDRMPEHRSTRMVGPLKRGRMTLRLRHGRFHRVQIPEVAQRPISARNAPQPLLNVIRKMIREEALRACR
jgi:hypothetical protein